MPISNPCEMSKEEKRAIYNTFDDMRKGKKIENSELNKTVLTPLDLENRSKKITACAKALSKARREGIEVSEIISGIEGGEAEELEGAEIISGSKGQQKLDEF